MRHVSQKLRFTPIGQLSRFPRSRVLLDTVPQVEHHLIDLCLQRVHLTARLHRDEPGEIAIHSCGRYLSETANLRGQVSGHRVDGHTACPKTTSQHTSAIGGNERERT